MSTIVNGHAVVGQTELADGDLVRFGDAQPLVFQHDSLVPPRSYMNGGYNGIEGSNGKRGDLSLTELPVLGKRIIPSPNRRAISAKSMRKKRSESADQAKKRSSLDQHSSSSSTVGLPPTPQSAPFSRLHSASSRQRSVGNELLQRVVKLQGEVARRDEEMRMMRAATARQQAIPLNNNTIEDSALRQARRENERLRDLLMFNNGNHVGLPAVNGIVESMRPLPTPEIEHQIYKAFAVALASELKRFGDRVISKSATDYSDLFSAFVMEMDDPFSIKMLEIEAGCEAYLTEKGYDRAADTVRELFRSNTIPEGIAGISSHLEALWPVLKDGMTMARDSARACVVLNNWSKRLGDQMRVSGITADRLLQAADDLDATFSDGRLKTHWLIPCLHPLLRTAAIAMKDKEEGVVETRKRRSISDTEAKIAAATGPLLQQIDEKEKRNEELMEEKAALQSSLEASQDALKSLEEYKERLEKTELELSNFKDDRDRERAEFDERIERLEEELRKAVEEKESLEEELVDEAEKIHHNVTQSVEKMRRKRSIRFAEARPSSADSDSMSVATPGWPIQRPTMLPSPMTPAGVFPSPIISLTDTNNTLKMASIDEESCEDHREEEEDKEEEKEGDDEKDEEAQDDGKIMQDDEEGEEKDAKAEEEEEEPQTARESHHDEEDNDDVVASGDDAQGHGETKDQPEEGEHVIESRSVHSLEEEHGKEEEEKEEERENESIDNFSPNSESDEEMDAASGVEEEETPRIVELEEGGIKDQLEKEAEIKDQEESLPIIEEVEEEKEMREGEEIKDHGETDMADQEEVKGHRETDEQDEDELAMIKDQVDRLNELRVRAQRQLAPGSKFNAYPYDESIGTAQMIFDLTTEFRRTANFLRGLLAVSPLSEFDRQTSEEREDNEETNENDHQNEEHDNKEDAKERRRRLRSEKREEILEELERLVEFAEVVKDSGKGESEEVEPAAHHMDNSAIMKQLNDALLDRTDVPKGIAEVRFASHLNSHLNTASGRPPTGKQRVKLPIKAMLEWNGNPFQVAQVSTPNGTVVQKPPTPPLRQPRFKF
ncbi:hypothetical protein PRIPAC_89474 [Pristionchus pacificus]|uniref:Uncharacterized protein n=1 Tax=Pristionchus pacificus TaxID=54126 RepID=A0A2A6CXR3_PRIPA|nr:hypothetical protein PRIPAC_89474 [Pristionchus pacificus]|eukprot:PDM83012.1 hypothetical protein PRIPAC_37405 [Pristionchus pacificus]